jgi:capsid protein
MAFSIISKINDHHDGAGEMTANYLIEGATWRGPRSGRMAVVPVRITTALLTRIRARGIPVSKFLREAGEKAADIASLPPQGKGE